MRIRGYLVVVASLSLTLPPAMAQVSFEAVRFSPSLDATARVVEGGVGTDVDFTSDLGMEREPFNRFRLAWRAGGASTLALQYERTAWSGDRVVTRDIEYAGATYTVGTRVASRLALESGRVQWVWQPIGDAAGTVRFGPILEVVGLSFDGSLNAPDLEPPVTASDTLRAVVPAVGAALDIEPVPWLRLYARGSFLDAGSRGAFHDAEAGIAWTPGPHLSLLGGYRSVHVRVESHDDHARMQLDGPFFGLSVTL